MNRRNFLDVLLGAGAVGAAGACQIVPATPEQVREIAANRFEYTCLKRGGGIIERVCYDLRPNNSLHLSIDLRFWDLECGIEVGKFFLDRSGRII